MRRNGLSQGGGAGVVGGVDLPPSVDDRDGRRGASGAQTGLRYFQDQSPFLRGQRRVKVQDERIKAFPGEVDADSAWEARQNKSL